MIKQTWWFLVNIIHHVVVWKPPANRGIGSYPVMFHSSSTVPTLTAAWRTLAQACATEFHSPETANPRASQMQMVWFGQQFGARQLHRLLFRDVNDPSNISDAIGSRAAQILSNLGHRSEQLAIRSQWQVSCGWRNRGQLTNSHFWAPDCWNESSKGPGLSDRRPRKVSQMGSTKISSHVGRRTMTSVAMAGQSYQ